MTPAPDRRAIKLRHRWDAAASGRVMRPRQLAPPKPPPARQLAQRSAITRLIADGARRAVAALRGFDDGRGVIGAYLRDYAQVPGLTRSRESRSTGEMAAAAPIVESDDIPVGA